MGELQIEISNMNWVEEGVEGGRCGTESHPLMCYMCKFTVLVLEINAFPLFIKTAFF